MAALTARYRVGTPKVRAWLTEAGIPIRTMSQAGRRRQLTPPPAPDLRRLYVTERLPTSQIAAALGVSSQTVLQWLDEAGIELLPSPLKDRRRGDPTPLGKPTADTLRGLYETERRSLAQVAAETGTTVHLVRSWMDEYNIARRPGGGRKPGGRPRPMPRRRPPPPCDELERLRIAEHWSITELAAHYHACPQTIRAWLSDYHLRADPDRDRDRPRRRLPGLSAADLVERYQHSHLTVAELTRQTGLTREQVANELRAAGVPVDRTRRRPPPLTRHDRDWMLQRYLADEWPMTRIADELGRTVRSIRSELVSAGVAIVPRSGASRQDRTEAPPTQVRRLYVTDRLTAEQTGETLTLGAHIVLRTGHSYGLPIRPPGPDPLIPADVRLIEDLYADDIIADALQHHQIPRRAPTGGIAARFPVPMTLTADLVRELYTDAGCSSTHIELLTGQPAATIIQRMNHWQIPLRPRGTVPPVRARIRSARRQRWLDQVVERYQQTGSTTRLAWEYGCSQNTIQRWLAEAGVSLPGRGRWPRGAPRWTPPDP
jgi:DNA-binding transcriptional regulator YiaG